MWSKMNNLFHPIPASKIIFIQELGAMSHYCITCIGIILIIMPVAFQYPFCLEHAFKTIIPVSK